MGVSHLGIVGMGCEGETKLVWGVRERQIFVGD